MLWQQVGSRIHCSVSEHRSQVRWVPPGSRVLYQNSALWYVKCLPDPPSQTGCSCLNAMYTSKVAPTSPRCAHWMVCKPGPQIPETRPESRRLFQRRVNIQMPWKQMFHLSTHRVYNLWHTQVPLQYHSCTNRLAAPYSRKKLDTLEPTLMSSYVLYTFLC